MSPGSPAERSLPVVAVVGRPNVGKSTLVNRLAGRRGSIVGEAPGLTRDRVATEATWRGRTFEVFDTGGLLGEALGRREVSSITGKVAGQAMMAIEDADVVLLVIDVTTGATTDDLALAKRLRRLPVPVMLVANKADGPAAESLANELWSLGLGEPQPVSALHGRGTGDLLDRLVEVLPETPRSDPEPPVPSISIVGRPNVGKSSIFNALVGRERSIVHEQPGTTRDAVDSLVRLGERDYLFVDTAGLKRRAKTSGVEVYGADRTRRAISRSDLAIVVVDASSGATSQDQRIVEQVAEAGVGAILALNKWDLVPDPEAAEAAERSVEERLHFISYAPVVRTSALTGRGIPRLPPAIEKVLAARSIRIPTARLNQILEEAQQRTPIPRVRNRSVKVLYATQTDSAPPTFVLFTSGVVSASWLRFFERMLREEAGFEGNPIRVVVRVRPDRARRGKPGHKR